MNISKLKLAWKFITGGREGVLDYALDCANTFTDRLADAKKEDIKSKYENGVLNVTVPKLEEKKPAQGLIEIE